MSIGVLQSAMRKLGASPHHDGVISSSRASEPRSVSLAPREHGTYGQFALPLVAAHLSGSATWAAWLLTLAAVAAFVSHEPLLVVLGRRGERARIQAGPRAWRLLLTAAGVGGLAAIAGLVCAPSSARWSALACAVLVVPIAAQIARNSERSLLGELLVASALPALAVPVALSAGVSSDTAVGVWLVWALGFAAATFAVRDIVTHFKRGRRLPLRMAPLAAAAVLATAASSLGLLDSSQVGAVTPMFVTVVVLATRPPHPRHLRRTGWILLAATTLTALLLIGDH